MPSTQECNPTLFLAIDDCDDKIYTLADNKGQFKGTSKNHYFINI